MSWLRVLACRAKSQAAQPRRVPFRRARLLVESLEARVVAYAATGNLWTHPELLTLSFQPDGTNLGGQTSNLFATFNSRFGSASAWQNQILKAAQLWAQQTNLNFTVVTDNGAASGTGSYQQGDVAFGDIRIGGYAFNSSYLALGYLPPAVNNYSIAGDIGFNTSQPFNINSMDYDVLTVAAHELGHALGLSHSSSSTAVEYATYSGVDYALGSDDIAGIRSIYSNGSARSADAYDASSSNGSFAAATDITSRVDASKTALLSNLDITTTSDVDYYKVTAPAGSSGTLTLTVQSKGLSLLAPLVKVYNASQGLLKSASVAGYTGATATVSVSVTAGQQYYILVDGVDSTAFGTGAYAVTLNFGTAATPTVSQPNTQTANGNPMNGGGGLANRKDANGVSVENLLNVNLLGIRLNLGTLAVGLLQNLELPFVDTLGTGEEHEEHHEVAAPAVGDANLISALVLASQGQQPRHGDDPLQAVIGFGRGLMDASSPIVPAVVPGPVVLTTPLVVAPSFPAPQAHEADVPQVSGREGAGLQDKTQPPAEQPSAEVQSASPQRLDMPTTPAVVPVEMSPSLDRSVPAHDVLFADPDWMAEPRATSSLPQAEEMEQVNHPAAALAALVVVLGSTWRDGVGRLQDRKEEEKSV